MRLIFLLLLSCNSFAQSIDTIIDKGIYRSHFNYALKQPVFVSYKLYQGGGNCSRSKYHFVNDSRIATATQKDYAHSGYDEGHLANAEDFAGNCKNDELTFRFYNCMPQTPQLNRGAWRSFENRIRQESQKDSLLIICGGLFTGGKINGLNIPEHCWKVVQSLTTKSVIACIIFSNTDFPSSEKTDITTIQNLIHSKLPLK